MNKVEETFVHLVQPCVQSQSHLRSTPSNGIQTLPKHLNLETCIQTLAGAEGRGMRRREIGQMESLGRGQACVYGVKGRQDGRRGEVRPWGLWVGGHTQWEEDPRLGNQSDLDSPLCITLEHYLTSLSLCFFTCEDELIPVSQGHGDQVAEHMEDDPAQSGQLIAVRASSFQFAQSQPSQPLPLGEELTLITHCLDSNLRSWKSVFYRWRDQRSETLSNVICPRSHSKKW